MQCFVAGGGVGGSSPFWTPSWASGLGFGGPWLKPLSSPGSVLSVELSDQIQRALQLEEERKRAQEEAERLEADRVAALRAKEELERQAADQMKSQEQLVGAPWGSWRGRLWGWQSDTAAWAFVSTAGKPPARGLKAWWESPSWWVDLGGPTVAGPRGQTWSFVASRTQRAPGGTAGWGGGGVGAGLVTRASHQNVAGYWQEGSARRPQK